MSFAPKYASAANRQPTLYDGNVENLVYNIAYDLDSLDIKLRYKGNSHTFYSDNKKYCVVYFGDNDDTYLGFRLNDDNSVISSYLAMENVLDDGDKKKIAKGMTVLSLLFANIGVSQNEYADLIFQLNEYVEYATKNNLDLSNANKTFYKTCNSINKNIYLQMCSNDSDMWFNGGLAN